MNVSKTKFSLSKKRVVKIINGNPNFYNSKSNAVNTYFLVSENSSLITFESNSEKADFDLCIEELKKVIIIDNKELFAQKFAEVTFEITTRLKKSLELPCHNLINERSSSWHKPANTNNSLKNFVSKF